MGAIPDAVRQRFWAKVDRREPDECWNWTASRFRCGYGQFQFRGRPHNAHRLAFLFATGVDPGGKWVLHSCDNRACVNPRHLRLGNLTDNVRDMVTRNRQASGARSGAHLYPDRYRHITVWAAAHPLRGEMNPRARLSEAQVLAIRLDPRTGPQIAADYGIGRAAVNRIKTGRAWKHLQPATGSVKAT